MILLTHVTSLQHTLSVRLLHNIWASQIPQLLPQEIGTAMILHTASLRITGFNSIVMGKTQAIVIVMINVSAKVLPPPPPPQVSRRIYLGVGKQKLSI